MNRPVRPPRVDAPNPLAPLPDEVVVSCDVTGATDADRWPAVVNPTERWNGFVAPQFRPAVARLLARWQARNLTDPADDRLVLSPDGRTLVHLVPDVFGDVTHVTDWESELTPTRQHAVWAVHDLSDPTRRVAVGAWRWCWFVVA